MNWFKWFPVLWKDKSIIEDAIQEGNKMDGTKPGWKTTEFWLTLLGTTIPTLIGASSGAIPGKWAAVVLAASSAAYGLIRAITKNGSTGNSDATANVTVKAS